MAQIRFDDAVEVVLRSLPKTGPLFPHLSRVRAGDRATEFKQRCHGLGIGAVEQRLRTFTDLNSGVTT